MKKDPKTSNKSQPFAKRLFLNRRGNVAIITALVMIPLTFALGMAYDFTMAQSRKDQIDGMADVAALGAVTPSLMYDSASVSQAQATSLFNGQIATVSGVVYTPTNLTVTANDVTTGNVVNRTVTVTYTAASKNIFATLLGMPTFPISGTSASTSSASPNIDFYLLLDDSPSMEIAATSAGITSMVNATINVPSNSANAGGCAFGCHESNPTADNLQNPVENSCPGESGVSYPQVPGSNPASGAEDNFQLARCLGVTLRIDLVNQATQNLMTVAASDEASNGAAYRAAIYTIDYNFTGLQTLTSNLTTAQQSAANIASPEMYDNGCLTSTNCNNDEDSYLDMGLDSIDGVMPNPGNGTKNAGDTPQEVLFIVSDGVVDQAIASGGNCGLSTRLCAAINTNANWCTTIKARGIRIAFLYTTYNPLPTNSFYSDYVSPFQANIATDAQNCASPGLFYQVSTDGDISAALTNLFQKAVATARLTK